MVRKYSMQLVWHSCLTYKPSEDYNPELYATDGENLYKVVYEKNTGFVGDGIFITDHNAKNYWWADIIQSIKYPKVM